MKRLLSVSISAILLASILSACSGEATVVPNSHVTVAEVGAISTLNTDVATENFAADLAMLTTQDFYSLNSAGDLVANKEYGTVKTEGTSPFKVTYTMAKSASWSDGSDVDATDLALAVWAAQLPTFASKHSNQTLASAEIVGTPKPGENTLTIQFDKPIADWKTALKVSVPAHVVGKSAGIGGNTAAIRGTLVEAFKQNKTEVIDKVAAAYKSAFAPAADVKNFITCGAYTISKVSDSQVVLRAVPDFAGTNKPIAETVNLNFYSDNATAFDAIAKKKADVFSPAESLNEPQSDLVSAAKALDTKAINIVATGSNQVEQFVFNQTLGDFAESTYTDPKTALQLRLAFMNLIPKARSIDFANITQVVSKSDSFVFAGSSKNYSAAASSNGSSNYVIQDVEKASELIKPLGISRWRTIKVLFDSDSPSAVAEWTLLSDHASSAGLSLSNVSTSDPTIRLASGDYDVYLGPLPLLGSGSGSIQQLTTGPARIPTDKFETLTKDVTAATAKTLPAALSALDKALFDDGYGLPMYQLPTLLVYNNRIKNFTSDPFGETSTWGYWTWHVSADK